MLKQFFKTIFYLFILSSWFSAASGQTLKGIVLDSHTNEPVTGATVSVKGSTSNATVTGIDGGFILTINKLPATIEVRYIGYVAQEIDVYEVTGTLTVKLTEDTKLLDEVVVVGYGTVKRRDLTGSVSSADASEIAKTPVSDVAQALAGRVAGVLVTQNDGEPGTSIAIRVRGGISITQNNEPLYIIDGFPSESGLSTIEPSDIENIDVLKDASATAIYGARGANGVVVVTTKGGREGKSTVNYDGYFGVKQLSKRLAVLDPYEFVFLDYERRNFSDEVDMREFENNYGPFSNINNYIGRRGIDWQEEALGGEAITQNHKVSISGSVENLRYLLSYSRFNEDGFMPNSGARKDNIRLKLDHSLDKKTNISANVSYTDNRIFGIGTADENTYFNKMNHILQYRPTIGIKGDDRQLVESGEDPILVDINGNVMQNPILSASEEHKLNETRTFLANFSLSYKILDNLTFMTSVGTRYQTARRELFYGDESVVARRTSINGSIRNTENRDFQTSNTLTYDISLNKTRISLLAGQEWVTTKLRWFEASAYNFPNDDIGLNDLSLGATPGVPQSYTNNDNKLLSFFGRLFINHDEKYLLTATLRGDASSKFGANHKWGYFPSASFAWRVAEEPFIKETGIFSDLKFRLGYGVAGNNRIPAYGSLAILESATYPLNGQTASAYVPSQIPNTELKWEANQTFNIGLDIGFFDQRLVISPEFYRNRSIDLLLNSQTAYTSGYSSVYRNVGETENTGIDLSITTVNIHNRNLTWTTTLNLSHNRNKVRALSGEDFFLWDSGWGLKQTDYRIGVGESLGQIYGYVTEGLYQVSDFDYNAANQTYTLKEGVASNPNITEQPGYWKFKDIAGAFDEDGNPIPDGEITVDDRTVIGNATPDFYGGFNNTVQYRDFDFSAFFTFSVGNDVYNATKLYNTLAARQHKNVLKIADKAHRWVTIDESGKRIIDPQQLEQLNSGKTVAQYGNLTEGNLFLHSWVIEDGSFLRLSNVTLGYTLPRSVLRSFHIDKIRLYATANNLWILTGYSGFDPESSTANSSGLTPGVDWGAYPRARSMVFGLNVTF